MKASALAFISAALILTSQASRAQITSALPQSSPTSVSQAVTVGFLREDSVLIPIALFNGRVWRQAWPLPVGIDEAVAPALGDIPNSWWAGGRPALVWEFVKNDGTRERVRVQGTIAYEAQYGSGVGLVTNYVSPLYFGPNAHPSEHWVTAGIAGTQANLLEPIAELEKGWTDFHEITAMLPTVFGRIEPDLWKSEPAALGTLQDTSLPPPDLISAYVSRLPDDSRLFAFHGRRYIGGGRVTQVIGWLARRGDSPLTVVHSEGRKTDQDGKGDLTFFPTASFTISGRTFWIGQACMYEGGSYVVLEVGIAPPKQLVEMDAAGCS